MSSLIRWTPRRDLMSMSDAMDRLFDSAFVMPFGENFRTLVPSIDLVENAENYVVKAELPGFKPEDIDVHIEGNALVLRGKYDESKEEKGEYHVRERRQGNFERMLTLPTAVNSEKATAEFDQGVLTLTLPKHEAVMPKKIAIKATNVDKK
ncbi:MAG TPA: Hsp20/alpha crystallin family protein [Aggregatilineales bacterium]|nr:Hsp20/alpha crystallin family protein [Aggregatilineales bacterium]